MVGILQGEYSDGSVYGYKQKMDGGYSKPLGTALKNSREGESSK